MVVVVVVVVVARLLALRIVRGRIRFESLFGLFGSLGEIELFESCLR